MKYSIIIVTYNSDKHVYDCLRSIKDNPPANPMDSVEVIVVDNSGKNYGLDFVKVNESGSYPSGLNQGIAMSTGSVLVCCNPDIRVTEKWLDRLSDAMYWGQYDIIGPVTSFAAGIQGTRLNSQIDSIKVKFFIGFCFMLSRHTYDTIGQFDDQFEFEQDDIDYSIRAYADKRSIGVAPVYVEHVGHQSMDASSPEKRFLSLYRILKKYKDVNVKNIIGGSWPASWLDEVARLYPEVTKFESYISAR